MRWVPDASGRFPQRPYYARADLDERCEELVQEFLVRRRGAVRFPLSTEELAVLVERETEALDLYAELGGERGDVHGRTDFLPGRKPRVFIARELSEQPWREHRLRSTLAHELGHVLFHSVLVSLPPQLPLFPEAGRAFLQPCRRATIVTQDRTDWLEWQAGYASGAFLMPRSAVRAIVADLLHDRGLVGPLFVEGPEVRELVGQLQATFNVSAEAARVRLLQLGAITQTRPPAPLFPRSLLS